MKTPTQSQLAETRRIFYALHMNEVARFPVTVAKRAVARGLYRSIQCAMMGFSKVEGSFSKRALQAIRDQAQMRTSI